MKLGLVGIGAIAVNQHIPAIQAESGIVLCAAASHAGIVAGIENYKTLTELLAGSPEVEALTLCVPPPARFALAREAIAAGKHVFLEKPPGISVAEVAILESEARAAGVSLLASWHSRFAPAVQPLRARLADLDIKKVTVTWREDVRVYHPGQRWIWEAGGFGCFDPGINALSILTHALPRPFRTASAKLFVPENCAQPIRAELALVDSSGVPIKAVFDFDQPDPPTWDIHVETATDTLTMTGGGTGLTVNGSAVVDEPEREYPALYSHFLALVATGASDVDTAPLQHVADAYMAAEWHRVKAFHEN